MWVLIILKSLISIRKWMSPNQKRIPKALKPLSTKEKATKRSLNKPQSLKSKSKIFLKRVLEKRGNPNSKMKKKSLLKTLLKSKRPRKGSD